MARKPLISANAVTAARLLAMPYLAWLVYQGHTGWWYALVVGTVIGSTDFVDGYLARKHGPTVLGGLLDPIADKVLIASWYLPLADTGLFSVWLIAFLLMREFLVTALRSAFERRDMQMKTSYLAKVKTWVQMQGLGVAILMLLLADRRELMTWILAGGAILPTLVAIPVYFVQKRVYWSALVMTALQGFILGVYVYAPVDTTVFVLLLFVVGLTWVSGADYLLVGYPKLRRSGDFGRADAVRVLGALALPLAVAFCMVRTEVSAIATVGIIAIELAVGGLDNLLNHHRAGASATHWAARVLGATLLLLAAALAPELGMTGLVQPLAFAALAVSFAGGALEFWRGRDYYLDSRLRDKTLEEAATRGSSGEVA